MHPWPDERERFWDQLVSTTDRRLRGYVRRCRCDEDVLEEIVQEVWARAVEREIEICASQGAWPTIHDIARQVCRAHVRARRHQQQIARHVGAVSAPTPDSDSSDSEARQWTAVQRAMSVLSEKQRQAVDFRYRWRWPYWAVAAAIDASEETARVHTSRGLRKLQRLLMTTDS